MTEIHTEFGTRALLLQNGGSITLIKTELEMVVMSVCTANSNQRVELLLTCPEAMHLIETLAVAARPGTGKPFVEGSVDHKLLPR
jgi:hypothetical protein